jgi:hypothetical protein
VSIPKSRHVSISVSTISFWTKKLMEVPSPIFLKTQVLSVIQIEAQGAKNKDFIPHVPIPYLTLKNKWVDGVTMFTNLSNLFG